VDVSLRENAVLKFNSFVPIYNWIYPVSGSPSSVFAGPSASQVFHHLPPSRSRALYFHVPFCETICSFCPFTRTTRHSDDEIDAYVAALLEEIRLKGHIPSLTEVPIGAVFFGGGTPSLLPARHILAIGETLAQYFDLSQCREYSFEFEVKSVDQERIDATRQIGVTHARFGAQTFSPAYRKLFTLTATVDQVCSAAAALSKAFQVVSCDVLFGMNGQDENELLFDINAAADLALKNVDFYPIDNLVTQPRLTRAFRMAGMPPTSGLTKHYMNILVREALRGRGFLPHNGHGYVRVSPEELKRSPTVTDEYSFIYHEHVLGYPDYDLLGFGVNAISSFSGFVVRNHMSRTQYIRGLVDRSIPMNVFEHSPSVDACRPVALALPYHGKIPRDWIDTALLPSDVHQRLQAAISHGLVEDAGGFLSLTRIGWEWYSTLMHYLLPSQERHALQRFLDRGYSDPSRDVEPSGLDEFELTPIGGGALQ
jgi:coproporphyrinogen III oxidase-like Fe-S oxidoreductase